MCSGGVKGLIVPDVPLEESAVLCDTLNPHGIDIVQLVSLTSPPERIARIAAASQGFVYAVTVNGITGFVQTLRMIYQIILLGYVKQVKYQY